MHPALIIHSIKSFIGTYRTKFLKNGFYFRIYFCQMRAYSLCSL